MTPQGQLADSVRSVQSQTVPPPTDILTRIAKVNTGLLGNTSSQVYVLSFEFDGLLGTYRRLLSVLQPAFKLAALKRQKFTQDGKQQRIERSLAALNAPQPTILSLAQWKEIVEEMEEED